MRTRRALFLMTSGLSLGIVMIVIGLLVYRPEQHDPGQGEYTGALNCRECHERFYLLWSTSHHGLAMQPFTAELARTKLTPQEEPLQVGDYSYHTELDDQGGKVVERGPDGEKTYPLVHALGGKNVFFFLTPMERGRLQTLPVAYDVNEKRWYDMSASAVRHFPDHTRDEALHWTDSAFTFNTSCHGCHLSQLRTNYDPEKDSYHTTWTEPGINCETCHGPGGEHVRVCKETEHPDNLRILSYKDLSLEQEDTTCAPCHAKMSPITASFQPGETYFDHYDLVTLEHQDFYPDGRDLGENYTYTLWRMNPCAKAGKLGCLHCHTSSGRYRFAKKNFNGACLPCHEERVANAQAHHHHPAEKKCIDCHMPMTRFARMARSDHSMRPPMPKATLAFKSPNACTLCHKDKDAEWAAGLTDEWFGEDYQETPLRRARLIAEARRQDWDRLDAMLACLTETDREEIVAATLIRLLMPCTDERKWPALIAALKDPSPLVRSAAAQGLSGFAHARNALLEATEDPIRLVRIRAAEALAAAQIEDPRLDAAMKELLASLTCRPDDWTSHYNLGNLHASRGDQESALSSYLEATRLRPDATPPRVNTSLILARMGRRDEAERTLREALRHEPRSAAANFNLGLLLANKNDPEGAERCLRIALEANPAFADAAHNLGVLLSSKDLDEAIRWCGKAASLGPASHKYNHTLAFYLHRKGETKEACRILKKLIDTNRAEAEAYHLLGSLYEEGGWTDDAKTIYRRASMNENLPPETRARFRARYDALSR